MHRDERVLYAFQARLGKKIRKCKGRVFIGKGDGPDDLIGLHHPNFLDI